MRFSAWPFHLEGHAACGIASQGRTACLHDQVQEERTG
jgi:hypothetical protein